MEVWLFAGAVSLSVLGVLAATVLSEGARIRRALRRTPRTSIAALRPGQRGRVVGKATGGEPMSAPLTGRPCLYFKVLVEQLVGAGWVPLAQESGGVPFSIEDDSGKARVDPGISKVLLVYDEHSASGRISEPTPSQQAFLARHRKKSTALGITMELRYHEAIVAPGETVAILGQGPPEPDPQVSQLRGARGLPLLISDEPDLLR